MRVIIYVEGPSDRLALARLLAPLIDRKAQQGISIEFFETAPGDRKASLLTKTPVTAVNILRNDQTAVVVALPDLYPRNKAFQHETVPQLVDGILRRFGEALSRKGIDDDRLAQRFHVFCLKYDLEALVLACERQLKIRLQVSELECTWSVPVEDQDHDNPPKRVVERLFRDHQMRYADTVDAPLILATADYREVAERCPQCFRPFVEFLEGL